MLTLTSFTLNEYQAAARETAVYPFQRQYAGLTYLTGKLCGEAGEVSEKTAKALRDDGAHPLDDVLSAVTRERREALLKELGDVLWYVAMAAHELGYTLEEVAIRNNSKLKDRQERGVLLGSGDDR